MAVRKLTQKQANILKFIISAIEKDHRTPTLREITDHFKLRSTGSVRGFIEALVKKGELVKEENLARGIRLNPEKYKVKVTKK